MRGFIVLLSALLSLVFVFSNARSESDPIHEKCTHQKNDPASWFYQKEEEEIGDPDLCEKTLEYWPRPDGVHGWCL